MNVEIIYDKAGTGVIPLTISMHNDSEIWFKNTYQIDSAGSIKFYCDWPYYTVNYFDLSTDDKTISLNYITVNQFIFDDFYNSVDLTYRGINIPNNSTIDIETDSATFNSIWYSGTLRYVIAPRPITNWVGLV